MQQCQSRKIQFKNVHSITCLSTAVYCYGSITHFHLLADICVSSFALDLQKGETDNEQEHSNTPIYRRETYNVKCNHLS